MKNNLFMTGSIAPHHKKKHFVEEEIPPLEAVENKGDDDVATRSAGSIFRDSDGGANEELPPEFPDVAAVRGAGDVTSVAASNGGLHHEKSSAEKDVGKPAPVSKAPPKVSKVPPAPGASPFHDLEALLRGDHAAEVFASNEGAHHSKHSTEKDFGDPEPPPKTKAPPASKAPPAPDLLRDNGEDAANVDISNAGALHYKNSAEKNAGDPKRPPMAKAPPAPKPGESVFESLRDQHQPSNGEGNGSNTGAHHAKWSQEQNAQNPLEKPVLWVAPEPTAMPTPGPTIDIRRVNPAPESEGEGRFEDCRAVDGVYFGNGQGGARNGGVVLRYRYELHDDGAAREEARANKGWYENNIDNLVDGGGGKAINANNGEEPVGYHLTRDILPKLEGVITNALIPVFFKGCPDAGEGGGRRLPGASGLGRRRNNGLRHRRLTAVVGIDGRPGDIPLGQQACELEFIASERDQTVDCHRMEGALTLYFPPNASVHSSILSAATLTTLRAIEQGMNDGSLALSHPAIRKLHFSADSYGLQPGLDIPRDKGGGAGAAPAGTSGAEQGNRKGNLGLILGITLPLIVLCCCCCLCVGLWNIRRRGGDDNDDDDDDNDVEDSMHSEPMLEAKKMFRLEDGYTDSGTEYDEEDTDSGTEHDNVYDEMSTDDESAKRIFQDQGYGVGAEFFVDDQGTTVSHYEISGDDSAANRGQDRLPSDFDEEDYSEPDEEEEDEEGYSVPEEEEEEEFSEPEEEGEDEEEYSEPAEEAEEEDYCKPEEEEMGETVATPAASNPLNPIFEEAERERAKKRKLRRQQKHVRRCMERLNRERESATFKSEEDHA